MSKRKKNNDTPVDEQRQEDFPGYPPYPPEDDITRNSSRVEGNLGDEDMDLNPSKGSSTPAKKEITADEAPSPSAEANPDEFDVTNEDLEALGPVDLSLDLGEDEQLKQRSHPVDFAGSNLDIPGSGDDDAQEELGSEDEENNSYSVGGDGHTDLEEGRQ
jgi:hypothetical protein